MSKCIRAVSLGQQKDVQGEAGILHSKSKSKSKHSAAIPAARKATICHMAVQRTQSRDTIYVRRSCRLSKGKRAVESQASRSKRAECFLADCRKARVYFPMLSTKRVFKCLDARYIAKDGLMQQRVGESHPA